MLKTLANGIFTFFSAGNPKAQESLINGKKEEMTHAFSEFTERDINALKTFLKSPKIPDADKKTYEALCNKIAQLNSKNKSELIFSEEEICRLQDFLGSQNRLDLIEKIRGATSINFHMI